MTELLPQKPKKFIQDLAEFDKTQTSLHMSVAAKNIERLKDLEIKNLWLIGAKEKDLMKILTLTQPENLDLYQVLATDLSVLETLTTASTLILIHFGIFQKMLVLNNLKLLISQNSMRSAT